MSFCPLHLRPFLVEDDGETMRRIVSIVPPIGLSRDVQWKGDVDNCDTTGLWRMYPWCTDYSKCCRWSDLDPVSMDCAAA